jgi:predicted nucleic acid-binding protein
MAAQPKETRWLIDTSIWLRADRGRDRSVQERLKALINAGAARLCWPVHAELLVGVKDELRWTMLDEGLSALEHVPIVDSTWRLASKAGWQLARRGETVPTLDLLIAAAAIEANLVLWTADSDFERVATVTSVKLEIAKKR